MVDTLTGNSKAGTVESLWPDVPPLAGATKTDLAFPRGSVDDSGCDAGKVSFIAFTTAQSAQEVQDFYSKERMKSAGWIANDRGCIGDTEDQKSQERSVSSIARMEKEGRTRNCPGAGLEEQTNGYLLCSHRPHRVEASPSPK
jgi:hypothetical protein